MKMSKFAAIFAAAVVIFTLGACVNGRTQTSDENTAIVTAV